MDATGSAVERPMKTSPADWAQGHASIIHRLYQPQGGFGIESAEKRRIADWSMAQLNLISRSASVPFGVRKQAVDYIRVLSGGSFVPKEKIMSLIFIASDRRVPHDSRAYAISKIDGLLPKRWDDKARATWDEGARSKLSELFHSTVALQEHGVVPEGEEPALVLEKLFVTGAGRKSPLGTFFASEIAKTLSREQSMSREYFRLLDRQNRLTSHVTEAGRQATENILTAVKQLTPDERHFSRYAQNFVKALAARAKKHGLPAES